MDGGARQQHGLTFEDWIKSTFFQSFTQTGYTDKWDATSISFKSKYNLYTAGFGGLPVSMKTCRYGSSINFGDALRQIENDEDFLLVVGFWQNSGSRKKIVSIGAVKVPSDVWQNLFVTDQEAVADTYETYLESETIKNIRELDRGIKRLVRPSHTDAREFAKKTKLGLPDHLSMSINPKIDSKTQRRVQCSLSFSVFQETFKNEFLLQTGDAVFWGETVPPIS